MGGRYTTWAIPQISSLAGAEWVVIRAPDRAEESARHRARPWRRLLRGDNAPYPKELAEQEVTSLIQMLAPSDVHGNLRDRYVQHEVTSHD
jgi:hypothetical protein